MLGLSTALGKEIEGFMHKGKIVGIVKDFHYKSLHNKIAPLVMVYNSFPPASMTLKLAPNQLGAVKEVWGKFVPQHPLEYAFLDAAFDAQYRTEERMISLFNAFTALAVLLSCLGLYGLVSFSVAQRTKEIGIRKVLGADIPHILFLLSRDFLKLVLLASLIACPLAYWLINKWLENYSSRVEIGFWFIITPCLLVLAIAILTVGIKTWLAAKANPVKALRYE
jgi:putative ABC transport system permease protein